jgi:UDP-N-acetylmuramoyl-tripeptide--D-alanyl-D-alanine ligase
MQAALGMLKELPGAGQRIAVLGDMREMGEAADDLHREMGRFAAGCGLDRLVCVGEKAALLAQAAAEAGLAPDRITHFADTPAAAAALPPTFAAGDLVLLKGSRYMRLERIAQAMADQLGCKMS